jgi:hypothetical protein
LPFTFYSSPPTVRVNFPDLSYNITLLRPVFKYTYKWKFKVQYMQLSFFFFPNDLKISTTQFFSIYNICVLHLHAYLLTQTFLMCTLYRISRFYKYIIMHGRYYNSVHRNLKTYSMAYINKPTHVYYLPYVHLSVYIITYWLIISGDFWLLLLSALCKPEGCCCCHVMPIFCQIW